MALCFIGLSSCSLCGDSITEDDRVTGFPHFLPLGHKLWRYSDSTMHSLCYEMWSAREEFEQQYEALDKVSLDSLFEWLQKWTEEHPCEQNRIQLTNLTEKKGWRLEIDICGTTLTSQPFVGGSSQSCSDRNDWYSTRVEKSRYVAEGGPANLVHMVGRFSSWVEGCEVEENFKRQNSDWFEEHTKEKLNYVPCKRERSQEKHLMLKRLVALDVPTECPKCNGYDIRLIVNPASCPARIRSGLGYPRGEATNGKKLDWHCMHCGNEWLDESDPRVIEREKENEQFMKDEALRQTTAEEFNAKTLDERVQFVVENGFAPKGAILQGVDLTGLKRDNLILDEVDISRATLVNTEFAHVQLFKANLQGSNLSGAKLDGANMNSSFCAGAVMERTRLVGARLIGADLTGANLNDADLSGGFLYRAVLDNASLIGAKLTGANLKDTSKKGTVF